MILQIGQVAGNDSEQKVEDVDGHGEERRRHVDPEHGVVEHVCTGAWALM